MKLKDLKRAIEGMPDDMEVYMAGLEQDFSYIPIENISQMKVNFIDGPGGKILSKERVIVLQAF